MQPQQQQHTTACAQCGALNVFQPTGGDIHLMCHQCQGVIIMKAVGVGPQDVAIHMDPQQQQMQMQQPQQQMQMQQPQMMTNPDGSINLNNPLDSQRGAHLSTPYGSLRVEENGDLTFNRKANYFEAMYTPTSSKIYITLLFVLSFVFFILGIAVTPYLFVACVLCLVYYVYYKNRKQPLAVKITIPNGGGDARVDFSTRRMWNKGIDFIEGAEKTGKFAIHVSTTTIKSSGLCPSIRRVELEVSMKAGTPWVMASWTLDKDNAAQATDPNAMFNMMVKRICEVTHVQATHDSVTRTEKRAQGGDCGSDC
eukprot:TRINITY_DN2002_c0_g1_i4.p1 TRINITY_DN2002_c0_g1~~TRINITY_DN2002_c0_g1_i4.p1  ORF type:complete len:321 (+),score=66.54 TRINITY_DN2002_c0_g1_i4:36-965(+)